MGVVGGWAQGASLYTESFDGSSGWQSTPGATVNETDGALRVSFPNIIPLPPASVMLLASNSASGGAFTGDFTAAGVQLIGFRFKADDAIPNSLLIELRSGSGAYSSPQLSGQVAQTGGWFHVWTALGEPGWIGDASVVTGVTATTIFIRQAGSTAERYYVDDFFTDSFPVGSGIDSEATDTYSVAWTHLRPEWTYQVQSCADLTQGVWSNVSTLAATSSFQRIAITNSVHSASFRLWR